MKYRIIKENEKIKIQRKSWFTFWFWRTWTRFGGSFGDEDVEFESFSSAEEAIAKDRNKSIIEIIKT